MFVFLFGIFFPSACIFSTLQVKKQLYEVLWSFRFSFGFCCFCWTESEGRGGEGGEYFPPLYTQESYFPTVMYAIYTDIYF